MHRIIEEGLEDYLSGVVRRDFQAHLDQCRECSREIVEFESCSGLLSLLGEKSQEPVQPDPGFYFRVSQVIETQKASPWSLFSLDAIFSRRIIFASLMTLALLGSVLVARDSDMDWDGSTPEAIMASHDTSAPHEAVAEREHMMATLASYQH